MCDSETMAMDIDDSAWCSGRYTVFYPGRDGGVRAGDEELYCSDDYAQEADFDLYRDQGQAED